MGNQDSRQLPRRGLQGQKLREPDHGSHWTWDFFCQQQTLPERSDQLHQGLLSYVNDTNDKKIYSKLEIFLLLFSTHTARSKHFLLARPVMSTRSKYKLVWRRPRPSPKKKNNW